MDNHITEIVERVLNGNVTADELKELTEWINNSDANRKELEKTEAIWNAIASIKNSEKFDATIGYNSFIEKIKGNKPEYRPIRFLNTFIKVAASILLLMGISYVTWLFLKPDTEKIAWFEITTPNGSHTQLTLTDGTKIWLNAGSKLRYPNKFNGRTRNVYLEGEAFFNVKKDPKHPFIVETSDINIKALGTSFNVKAYPNEGSIETTLVNGIIIVENNKTRNQPIEPVKLIPNQRVTFIKTKGKLLLNEQEQKQLSPNIIKKHAIEREKESLILSEDVNTELYTSWIENRMMFDNETFESIALKLERRYGATVIFKDNKLKNYRFSGKFPEISIDRALKALQYASPFTYEITQDTIFIN
jgi:ferric-dicitrate binding protein FerR (iron transport regulator)